MFFLNFKVFNSRSLYYFVIINATMLCFFTIDNQHGSLIYINEDKKPEPVLFAEHHSNLSVKANSKANDDSAKYILLWTNPKSSPFVYFGEGNKVFIDKKCKWTNCYVTGNREYLGRYTEFDVIAFNGPQLTFMINNNDEPRDRSFHQKYVYANIESSHNYPVNTDYFDRFFNWTWTYKLNSDAVWGYFVVKDANNNIIGPNANMRWLNVNDMQPIDIKLKLRLQRKKKHAVWFSSHCLTMSRRENYVRALQEQLKVYNIELDIFGKCGQSQCPKSIMIRCLNMVRRDYYFYLAFENAFSDDYVTEKVVYALNYDAVPIVYGGANYSRFLPDGIYLDAVKLGPGLLAKTMNDMIRNPEMFHKFFRWKKHYSFEFRHESPDADDYCNFCSMVNNITLMSSSSVYDNFSSWWMS